MVRSDSDWEVNTLTASKNAWGDHSLGLVSASSSSQYSIIGITWKDWGSLPLLNFLRISPILLRQLLVDFDDFRVSGRRLADGILLELGHVLLQGSAQVAQAFQLIEEGQVICRHFETCRHNVVLVLVYWLDFGRLFLDQFGSVACLFPVAEFGTWF